MAPLVQAGIAALQRGQAAEATVQLALAAKQQPGEPQILYLLGVAQLAAGQPLAARQSLGAAVEGGHRTDACYQTYALALECLNDHAGAEAAYRKACSPAGDSGWRALAGFLERRGAAAEAGDLWKQIIGQQPADWEARMHYAAILHTQRRWNEAIEHIQAIPEDQRGNCWTLFSAALVHAGRFDTAATAARTALAENPFDAAAMRNLALALQAEGSTPDAVLAFESALRLTPEDAQLRWNYAMALLQAGRWKEGWAESAIRTTAGVTPPLSRRWPLWAGQPPAGKSIYVRAEQGLGDTLQFLRYARLLHEAGARVELAVQPLLVTLLREQPFLADVYGYDDLPAGIDYQVLLLDLPGLFGTLPDSIPPPEPFLKVPGRLSERWRRELSRFPKPWIVVNWRGNPRYAWDHFRSTTAETLAPLWRHRAGTWFHLDPGGSPPAPLVNPLPASATLADTAAILEQMDLTITTDTMLAHLAGSLGVRVWTLLSQFTDWRWSGHSAQSPWYPTMRLFRQQRLNDWGSVVRAVDNELP